MQYTIHDALRISDHYLSKIHLRVDDESRMFIKDAMIMCLFLGEPIKRFTLASKIPNNARLTSTLFRIATKVKQLDDANNDHLLPSKVNKSVHSVGDKFKDFIEKEIHTIETRNERFINILRVKSQAKDAEYEKRIETLEVKLKKARYQIKIMTLSELSEVE